MKESLLIGLLLLLLLFGIPWASAEKSPPQEQPEIQITQETVGQKDAQVSVIVWDGEKNVTMTLEEYLPGVVRGEMPAVFEQEALKAQAVAERTYIYYRMHQERKAAHPEADVCLDSSCCASYISARDAAQKWGENGEEYEEKIQQAVAQTDGQVVLYEGEPIMAVFHSSSAGHTAKSGDVWQGDIPYLSSVVTPESGQDVPNYYSVSQFSPEEFKKRVQTAYPETVWEGTAENWITDMERTASDRVASVKIGGVVLSGSEVRRLFDLRSACFTTEIREGDILFHVTGYGHGVGMSQYGANAMAKAGSTYREILQWYYTGVTIGGYTKP